MEWSEAAGARRLLNQSIPEPGNKQSTVSVCPSHHPFPLSFLTLAVS